MKATVQNKKEKYAKLERLALELLDLWNKNAENSLSYCGASQDLIEYAQSVKNKREAMLQAARISGINKLTNTEIKALSLQGVCTALGLDPSNYEG